MSDVVFIMFLAVRFGPVTKLQVRETVGDIVHVFGSAVRGERACVRECRFRGRVGGGTLPPVMVIRVIDWLSRIASKLDRIIEGMGSRAVLKCFVCTGAGNCHVATGGTVYTPCSS